MTRDRVTPETYAAVLVRDRACVLSKIEPDHLCRDQWGTPHASTDLARMSLEHVKDQPRMGKRARWRDRTVLGTEYLMLDCGCQHWVEWGYRLTSLLVAGTWLLRLVIGEDRAIRLGARLINGPLFYSRVVSPPVGGSPEKQGDST